MMQLIPSSPHQEDSPAALVLHLLESILPDAYHESSAGRSSKKMAWLPRHTGQKT
jgi:hypothetical protein